MEMGRENISMKEELEKLAAAGKLTRQNVEALVALTGSGYCFHRSWGFGKIVSMDLVFARCVIDFQTKTGHAMDLTFAAEATTFTRAKFPAWMPCAKWPRCTIWI